MARDDRFEDVTVDRVMTGNPATIEPEATLSDAAEELLRGGFRHLPVVDAAGRLVGILSERDLRGKLGTDLEDFPEATLESLSEPVSSAMRPDPITVAPTTSLGEVLEIFADERVGAVPVVADDERLVGIVSYVDLLGYLRERGGGPPAHAPSPSEFELPPDVEAQPQPEPAKAGTAALPSTRSRRSGAKRKAARKRARRARSAPARGGRPKRPRKRR